MIKIDPGSKINFARQNIKSGETVSVQFLKQISKNIWTVSINNKNYSITTDIKNPPEGKLAARVQIIDGKILIKLLDKVKLHDGSIIYSNVEMNNMVKNILISHGITINESLLEKVFAMIKNNKISKKEDIAIILAALGKGLDISKDLENIISEVSFYRDHKNKKDRKNKNPDDKKSIKLELKRKIIQCSSRPGFFALFNHIKPDNENWIIIPYSLILHNDNYFGLIHVNIDNKEMIKKLVINTEYNNIKWKFHLNCTKSPYELKIYTSDIEKAEKLLKNYQLSEKLYNLGVFLDDNIVSDNNFDGFYQFDEDIRSINTFI